MGWGGVRERVEGRENTSLLFRIEKKKDRKEGRGEREGDFWGGSCVYQ